MRAAEGQRVLFMPHSPGIYLALVLKNADEIEMASNAFSVKDMNMSE